MNLILSKKEAANGFALLHQWQNKEETVIKNLQIKRLRSALV